MLGTLHTPVLSLTPDSLASLGTLDNDSLSELWGVFTKCKDSLQNGRRLENLSWRLWFDSGRRESTSPSTSSKALFVEPPSPATTIASVDTEGWSDPEWTSEGDTTDDNEEDEDEEPTSSRPGRPRRESSSETTTTYHTINAANRRGSSQGKSATPLNVPDSKARSISAAPCSQTPRPSLATTSRGSHSREWRTSTTISGPSIQRIVAGFNSLPPIVGPSKARSIANVPIASASPLTAGDVETTSRHSSAPEPLEVGILAENALALHSATATLSSTSPRRKVDAPTQTTPSSSHRPSPSAVLRSPPSSMRAPIIFATIPPTPIAQASTSGAHTSKGMVRSNSGQSSSSRTSSRMNSSSISSPAPALPRHMSSSLSAGGRKAASAGKLSSAPTPAPTPAPSLVVANHLTRTPSASHMNNSPSSSTILPSSSIAKSSTKGFDTRVEDARPRNGSIAPPPTPAVALKSLGASPPKSAMKSTPADANANNAVAKAKGSGAPTKKQMFFISSPASDSDDDGGSSCRSRRYSSGAEKRSAVVRTGSSLNNVKGKGREMIPPVAAANDQDDEWDDEDDDDEGSSGDESSSGWGSEYSTESEEEGSRQKQERNSKALFQKRPSVVINGDSPLKPRPPGLLSQLFHPDLLLNDTDRAHSSVDVVRARSNLSMTAAPNGKIPTSRSHGMLSAQRSKSFLKGAPEGVELESSSDEGSASEAEDGHQVAEVAQRNDSQTQMAVALARHAQRQRQLEAEGAIAPPQTPRTTRRAMLATELSESLRRNLLWERQTRNRVMGAATARAPTMPPTTTNATAAANAPAPASSKATLKATSADGALGSGLRAPNSSPAAQAQLSTSQQQQRKTNKPATPSPAASGTTTPSTTMVRRHTTGTGLYLAAQLDKLDQTRDVPRRQRRRSGGLSVQGIVDGDDTSTSVSSDEEGGTGDDDYGDSMWSQRVW